MKCERCGAEIKQGEEREYYGEVLCEDCYMDALSPTRVCDPWAVYTAKSLSGKNVLLNEVQQKILRILGETGGIEVEALAEKLNMKEKDLQRELAALRHMEKVRAEMRNGRKVICLWQQAA